MSDALFHIENVSLSFGGLKAVVDFQMRMNKGDLHGLIGPNGAGKTTIFNLITGVYRPDEGSIELAGKAMQGKAPWAIAYAGIARTFQNIRLFLDLSIIDNVRTANHLRKKHTLIHTMLRSPRHLSDERTMMARAMQLLEVIGLLHVKDDLARNLPYGDQRRLEIARALATNPKVLLLDEPAAGMNPSEKKSLITLIQKIRQMFDVTILLIDHDMNLVMKLCEKITVLDHGQIIAVGTPQEVQGNEEVIKAYLGEPA